MIILSPTAQFTLSNRGNRQIKFEGFRYSTRTTFNRKHGPLGRKKWYCSTHHAKGCKAALFTVDEVVVLANTEHTHTAPKY